MTPAVQAVSQLQISGNIIPHVWYQRTEFRTPSNRPDRDMITTLADILYWYRPREVRDEETGLFVRYERKFVKDMLQYDYARRAAVFGMSKRQMQEACTKLSRAGLIRIEYRTEAYRGKAYSNIVYIEPVAEVIKATLTAPNAESVEKGKMAPRGMHVRKDAAAYNPDAGVDDQTPGEDSPAGDTPPIPKFWDTPPYPLSQIFGTPLSQNSGIALPKIWDTYHETSLEISFSRDFKKTSSSVTLSERAPAAPLADDDDLSPDGGTPEGTPEDTDAEGGEDLLLDQLVGSGVEGEESGTAEGVEDVPPAAAAPVENSEENSGDSSEEDPAENPGAHTWAILALEPIPLAELQARPARDPEKLKVLRALMRATNAKRLDHLHEQLALPGTHRHLLSRLTDAELDRAAKAASYDARHVAGNMRNAGYYALDRLLGKVFTVEMLSGQAAQAAQPALGHAYDVKNEGARPAPVQADAPVDAAIEAEGALAAGKIWRHKASGTLVRIERIDGPTVYLDSGDRLSLAKFSTSHVKHTAQQAAS
ncbi:hypothetical protein [Deinococcus sp. 12RED42]|uniref:hypothetical protein n=1 Tax=Deinococcus sp. 12RED42 TaxID=2745872 RepID=UPI001E615333|nr:hypothetical protein [Deinococcus sp. 12RED42]MCD0166574.1 hypothetical protein [Deinococcus sp. 12RED42]